MASKLLAAIQNRIPSTWTISPTPTSSTTQRVRPVSAPPAANKVAPFSPIFTFTSPVRQENGWTTPSPEEKLSRLLKTLEKTLTAIQGLERVLQGEPELVQTWEKTVTNLSNRVTEEAPQSERAADLLVKIINAYNIILQESQEEVIQESQKEVIQESQEEVIQESPIPFKPPAPKALTNGLQ